MFQARFHGRGGQGVVTAAELLSVAAFLEGRHAQAFPSFGPERTGAPVVAYCRIDDRPIRTHEPIGSPDAIVIQDATLLHAVAVLEGLSPDGYVVLNSARTLAELGVGALAATLPERHARAVPASDLSRARLGKPLPNAALLGALAALTGAVGIEAVVKAIESRFDGAAGAANADAARAAFAAVKGAPC